MKNSIIKHFKARKYFLAVPALIALLFVGITGCEKDEVPGFNPDFTIEKIDENNVKFSNQSTGEYYWMVWDFGNGTTDTITNRNQDVEVYYPASGTYDVTLRLTNYYGSQKSVTKTVSITNDDVQVSFTAETYDSYPNFVLFTNTSTGVYDSFHWNYLDNEVEDVDTYTAYFPFAGDYEVQLTVTQAGVDYIETQTIVIADDDPDYDPNLIWREEFINTGRPDQSNWNYETGGGGWGNNELQTYTDSEDNAYVDNGMLTITAIDDGGSYTSARLTTQDKFDFKYGRIEARIKLPYGQGMWPAFWMLGANFSEVGWPYCGEIDIMEMVGGENGDNTCHATLHWWDDSESAKADYGLPYTLPNGIFADDFHVFSVEWDAQEIRAYMDGNEYFVADISSADLSEFQENFFIILNLAVGGDWPGPPDATTEFPQTMQVDWVRVYQQ